LLVDKGFSVAGVSFRLTHPPPSKLEVMQREPRGVKVATSAIFEEKELLYSTLREVSPPSLLSKHAVRVVVLGGNKE
jgi:hypothetical protein